MAIMGSGLSSLHKVLKDETRRKIILLLNEKSSLSYTELINTLGISSTGTLNYHLKILSELISKNESGLYILTEKGRLASQLLLEFPDKKTHYQTEPQLPRLVRIATVIVSAIFMVGFFALYIRGVIDFSRFVIWEFVAISATIIFLVSLYGRRIIVKWSTRRQMSTHKMIHIGFYALAGAAVFLSGGSLLLVSFQTFLNSVGIPFSLFPVSWWIIISCFFGPIIGGCLGYFIYKRSKYSKAVYYR